MNDDQEDFTDVTPIAGLCGWGDTTLPNLRREQHPRREMQDGVPLEVVPVSDPGDVLRGVK